MLLIGFIILVTDLQVITQKRPWNTYRKNVDPARERGIYMRPPSAIMIPSESIKITPKTEVVR